MQVTMARAAEAVQCLANDVMMPQHASTAEGGVNTQEAVVASSNLSFCLWCNIVLAAMLVTAHGVGHLAAGPSPFQRVAPTFCNMTMHAEVLPFPSMDGSQRLQQWIHKRSVPWHAAHFVMPTFHPSDAEAQAVPTLPPPLLKVAGPAWSCVPQHPHLHALWCTWTPCQTAGERVPHNHSEWEALGSHAFYLLQDQLHADATVVRRHQVPPLSDAHAPDVIVVEFEGVAPPVPRACASGNHSSVPHVQIMCWHVGRGTWVSDLQALWRFVVALRPRGGSSEGSDASRAAPHTIVWPQWKRWWNSTTAPVLRHSFSVLQRLIAIGVTQVAVGEPEQQSRAVGVLQVQLAPLDVHLADTDVTDSRSLATTGLADHRVIGRPALWVKQLLPFLERFHSLQVGLHATRRRGLGVARAQLDIVEAHCEGCFDGTHRGRPLWDTVRVDGVVPFLSAMQC